MKTSGLRDLDPLGNHEHPCALRAGVYIGFHSRVSYGGGWNFLPQPQFPPPPPPPPRNLELSMVTIVLSQVLNNNLVPDCVSSNLRGSKFNIFVGGMPPDPPKRHARLRMRTLLSSRYTILYHPVPLPPNSKSCMKPCTGI